VTSNVTDVLLLYKQAHIANILFLMPQFVGSSYDAAAWQGCLTWLGQQVSAAQSQS